MRRYERRIGKHCGYGVKKKGSRKRSSKATFDLGIAEAADKSRKKKRCKSIRKDGVTVRVCGRKKSEKKKTRGGAGIYTNLLQVGYGERVQVHGRLVERSGKGVPDARIKIGTSSMAESSGDREYRLVGEVKTTESGLFSYRLPRGGGRHVKAFYDGSPTRRRAESRAITLFVKSRVGFKLRPRNLPNGRRVRISGRVYHQGDKTPRSAAR